MFTGLVQAVGEVGGVETIPEGVRLEIDPCGWDPGAGRGGSVCGERVLPDAHG
jgi:riboflavin synthase alpha subunit